MWSYVLRSQDSEWVFFSFFECQGFLCGMKSIIIRDRDHDTFREGAPYTWKLHKLPEFKGRDASLISYCILCCDTLSTARTQLFVSYIDPVQVQFKSFKRSLRRARPFCILLLSMLWQLWIYDHLRSSTIIYVCCVYDFVCYFTLFPCRAGLWIPPWRLQGISDHGPWLRQAV